MTDPLPGALRAAVSVDEWVWVWPRGDLSQAAIERNIAEIIELESGLRELVEAAGAIDTDAAQDALEDPMGYEARKETGCIAISVAAVARLRTALARVKE